MVIFFKLSDKRQLRDIFNIYVRGDMTFEKFVKIFNEATNTNNGKGVFLMDLTDGIDIKYKYRCNFIYLFD